MSKSVISVIIPSRDRPLGLLCAIVSVLTTTKKHAVEIIPVLDAPDRESIALLDTVGMLPILYSVVMSETYVHGHAQHKFQAGYEASVGDWLVTGSDDITFQRGWLDAMLAHPNQGYIGFWDALWKGKLAPLVMASREYIETTMNGRFGLPWYHVHGSDAEWQARAKAVGAFTICPDAKFDHHRSDVTPDKLRRFGKQFHKKDGETYTLRRMAGFPEEWPEV